MQVMKDKSCMPDEAGPFEVQHAMRAAAADNVDDCSYEEVNLASPGIAAGPRVCALSRIDEQPEVEFSRGKVVPLFRMPLRSARALLPDSGEGVNLEPPERRYDCQHYDTCLSLAAALDWQSFSCAGCSGCVNRKLLWRANNALRRNSALRMICKLPLAV